MLFLALMDRHCIGAHTASPEESALTPWAGYHVSSVCLRQWKRKDPVGHPWCHHPLSHCQILQLHLFYFSSWSRAPDCTSWQGLLPNGNPTHKSSRLFLLAEQSPLCNLEGGQRAPFPAVAATPGASMDCVLCHRELTASFCLGCLVRIWCFPSSSFFVLFPPLSDAGPQLVNVRKGTRGKGTLRPPFSNE